MNRAVVGLLLLAAVASVASAGRITPDWGRTLGRHSSSSTNMNAIKARVSYPC